MTSLTDSVSFQNLFDMQQILMEKSFFGWIKGFFGTKKFVAKSFIVDIAKILNCQYQIPNEPWKLLL